MAQHPAPSGDILSSAPAEVRTGPQHEPAVSGDVPSQTRDVLPPDLPDDPVNVMPVFTSRRKAEALPSLRPAAVSNRLEFATDRGAEQRRAGWHSGFRWGLVAAVGGLCLLIAMAVGMGQ